MPHHFDERGMGKVNFGSFVMSDTDSEPPGDGICGRVPMNMNTFITGQYWYTVGNSIFVRRVTSQTGSPWELLQTEDDDVDQFYGPFAALVTGRVNEYSIIVRTDADPERYHFVVAKLTLNGVETVLAKVPLNLSAQGYAGPWEYDPDLSPLTNNRFDKIFAA